WSLPPGETLRSLVAVTSPQLRAYGTAPSRFLGCSDRSLFVFEAGELGIQATQVNLILGSSEQARFVMPMPSDQILLVTLSGTVLVTTPASANSLTVGQLHGEVRDAVSTGEGAGVVLRTADDGAYRIIVDNDNRVRIRRYVLQSPVAIQE